MLDVLTNLASHYEAECTCVNDSFEVSSHRTWPGNTHVLGASAGKLSIEAYAESWKATFAPRRF